MEFFRSFSRVIDVLYSDFKILLFSFHFSSRHKISVLSFFILVCLLALCPEIRLVLSADVCADSVWLREFFKWGLTNISKKAPTYTRFLALFNCFTISENTSRFWMERDNLTGEYNLWTVACNSTQLNILFIHVLDWFISFSLIISHQPSPSAIDSVMITVRTMVWDCGDVRCSLLLNNIWDYKLINIGGRSNLHIDKNINYSPFARPSMSNSSIFSASKYDVKKMRLLSETMWTIWIA